MNPAHFDPDEASDAAMRVFWRKGYAATSIQDLVDATGLSRSSLYNSFESKQGVFQQALRRYHEHTAALVELLTQDGSAVERVRALLSSIVSDELHDEACAGCLVANTALEMGGRDVAVTELLAEHFGALETALTALMQRGQAQGEIDRKKSPQALARFVLATIQGLRVIARGHADPQQVRRLRDVVQVAVSAL